MKRGNAKGESRPVSWCIGVPICPVNDPKCFLNSYMEPQCHEEVQKEDLQKCRKENSPPLSRGILVRSTSYQALHSALARLYRLDDFTLERIGQGFFSEVYKARHIVTGKIMVLKMNKLFSNRHNMLREVELMNRLHHPNILNYYGVCIHEGQVHALTQYINGGSLDTLLQNLRIELPWLTRSSLALDIARGMAYLHSKKVFHRDLTSKNILIQYSKEKTKHHLRAVIADFGLAAPIPQDKSVRLRQVGSPYWMAPEVIRGDWYDHRVDIFSFGILVCEIIARCDADPDILPRTHNFGVHYLAFSRMCQSDCPPSLLEMAFQCCQIEPDSRPSFKELESLLFYFISDNRPALSPRKQKVCHRRSLSDDSFIQKRSHSLDGNVKEPALPVVGSPQEVLERISAADPYFQPSSATVNPFSSVKLPAKSQLIVQDGGRCCHSMPADIRNSHLCQTPIEEATPAHLTTSDTSLSQGLSPTHSFSKCTFSNVPVSSNSHHTVPESCSSTQCVCKSNNHHHHHSSSSSSSCSSKSNKTTSNCKCSSFLGSEPPSSSSGRTHHVTKAYSARLLPGSWQHDGFHASGTSPRSDTGGGTLNPPQGVGGGGGGAMIRRRGSGESGFFSVEDELCLSYSELSSASFVSTEDDDNLLWHSMTLRRSPSVVTDSSEDLSSVGGCSHDQTYDVVSSSLAGDCEQQQQQSASPFYHSSNPPHSSANCLNAEATTDIKSIVEFFERGYGSLRSMLNEGERTRKLAAANARRKECLVPFLRTRFNASNSSSSSSSSSSTVSSSSPHLFRALGSQGGATFSSKPPATACFGGSVAQGSSSSKAACTKDKCRFGCCGGGGGGGGKSDATKRETLLRAKDRPKVYITEGTVRAKRNIFESK